MYEEVGMEPGELSEASEEFYRGRGRNIGRQLVELETHGSREDLGILRGRFTCADS